MPHHNPADLEQLDAAFAAIGSDKLEAHNKTLIRPSGDAELGNWMVASFRWEAELQAVVALHANYPALRDELRQLRSRVQELERTDEESLCNRAMGWVHRNESRLKREGAAEWLESYINGENIAAHRVVAIMKAEAARLREEGK